ncbi:hypothetical protein [Luteipulveratus mongoliensis]|uniref:hypothetical protein n=1 Tax=Luteipulveratus mongoliensis TaxID=571913 RepID=UPI0012EDD78A|nr:hypothetical protein [Luteipulveratus mongoliensis]
MVRSVPEKTFEHWASMYVSHRFPTGGLWWPTKGEDIRIEDLGTVPGKACLLEVKVPERLPDKHVTKIDVAQLERYLLSLVPVYYVIPDPPWTGDLATSMWLSPERRADLAYRRTEDRWFGHWTYVCTAADLYAHLSPSPSQTTASLLSRPPHWKWPLFWSDFAHCGGVEMPSLFLSRDVGPRASRGQLAESFSALRFELRGARGRQREEVRRGIRDSVGEMTVYVQEVRRSDTYARIEPDRNVFENLWTGDADEAQHSLCALPFDALS